MMKLRNILTLLAGVAVTVASASAKDIAFAKCPPEVQATIRSNARDGKIDEVELLAIEGRRMYIAEVEFPGDKELKIYVLASGTLFKTREEIQIEEAPEKVQAAARQLVAQAGKLDDVVKTMEADGTVSYEVEIKRPREKETKVVFSSEGTILSRKEKKSKD
jgi:uncharacterized membrane protein YkoI